MVVTVAIFAAVSCNKEISQNNPYGDNVIVFSASVDGVDTKVKFEEGKSKWEANDKITIHNGKNGFDFLTTQTGESVNFYYDNSNNDFSGEEFIAVYPAGKHTVSLEARTVLANLPTYQEAIKGTFNKSAALAIAFADDEVLHFKNAVALLKFTVKSSNIKGVEFYGNNREAVSGDLLISLDEDNSIKSVVGQKTMIDKTLQLGTWIKIYAPESSKWYFENGATYYAAIAPQTFSKGVSMNVLVDDAEVKVEKYKTVSTSQTINWNDVIDLGTIEEKKIYLAQGMWTDADAWVFAHFVGDNDWTEDRSMSDTDGDGILEVNVPYRAKEVIFVRKNPSDKNVNWDNKWNESASLKLPTDSNVCYAINDWGSMAWNTLDNVRKKMLYLKPNTNWTTNNARFATYFFIDNGATTWRSMTDYNNDGIYEVYVPNTAAYTKVIFCRMNGSSTTNGWTSDKWNQTGDLTIPTDGKNLFTVPSGAWDGSTLSWSKK